MNKLTIIIPVCANDADSLGNCISSLIQYAGSQHDILFVGNGDKAVRSLLSAAGTHSNMHYADCPAESGYSGYCNYALSLSQPDSDILLLSPDCELTKGCIDEMQAVMYECERNGAVCPRSNQLSFLSVPVHNNNTAVTFQASWETYCRIRSVLPRQAVIPVGFCHAMLIRRELIDRFGLFDRAFSDNDGADIDFCMRINQYGYNVIAANHAYIRIAGDSRRANAPVRRELLLERYPYYNGLIKLYTNERMHPADYFSDLIADNIYEKKRLLFSLYEIPASYNGTAKFAVSIYTSFLKLFGNKYDIYMLINSEADRFHKLSRRFANVYTPDTITGTFHLAFSPSQIFRVEHMIILNHHCLKYIFCMQDIICIRSRHILIRELERDDVFRDSIRFCDMMTSISNFALKDAMSYYSDVFAHRDIPAHFIYHGTDKTPASDSREGYSLPFKKYFLVFGNELKHKFVSNTMEQLKTSKYNIIVIGSPNEGALGGNIFCYRSGSLSDAFIDHVLAHCQGIIFPSLYEGFGLPFLDGMSYKKKLIVNNTEVNRELRSYFKNYGDNVYVFSQLNELEGILDEISANPQVTFNNSDEHIRSWEDSARELEVYIAETLQKPVDTSLLNERWRFYNYLSNIHINHAHKPVVGNYTTRLIDKEQFLQRMISKHPKLYRIYRKIIVIFDKNHYS